MASLVRFFLRKPRVGIEKDNRARAGTVVSGAGCGWERRRGDRSPWRIRLLSGDAGRRMAPSCCGRPG